MCNNYDQVRSLATGFEYGIGTAVLKYWVGRASLTRAGIVQARALEVPMYQLFYEGEEPPKLPHLPKRKTADEIAWGSSGKEARLLVKFRRLLSHMKEGDRGLMLSMAQKMARSQAER